MFPTRVMPVAPKVGIGQWNRHRMADTPFDVVIAPRAQVTL